MKQMTISNKLHKWIMDNKNSDHRSADTVLIALVEEKIGRKL